MNTEIGKIRLRNPAGYKTEISVTQRDDGKVDLHFSRTSEGEVLVILPPAIAAQLANLLMRGARRTETIDDRPSELIVREMREQEWG